MATNLNIPSITPFSRIRDRLSALESKVGNYNVGSLHVRLRGLRQTVFADRAIMNHANTRLGNVERKLAMQSAAFQALQKNVDDRIDAIVGSATHGTATESDGESFRW